MVKITDPRKERDENLLKILGRMMISFYKVPFFRLRYPDYPFYAGNSFNFIEKLIKERESKICMFEYGLGKSTLWWASRTEQYIGVEHSKQWYDDVCHSVQENRLDDKTILHFVPSSEEYEYNWEVEWRPYDIIHEQPSRPEFKDYIATIDQYPDHSFDLISIDGRERVGSAAHAIYKIKEDGIIIFDDSSRPRYEKALQFFKDWDKNIFEFGLQQTTVFTPRK